MNILKRYWKLLIPYFFLPISAIKICYWWDSNHRSSISAYCSKSSNSFRRKNRYHVIHHDHLQYDIHWVSRSLMGQNEVKLIWFVTYEGEVKSSKDRSPLDIELERFSKWFILNNLDQNGCSGRERSRTAWILTDETVNPKLQLHRYLSPTFMKSK